jgi:hypothetical protein
MFEKCPTLIGAIAASLLVGAARAEPPDHANAPSPHHRAPTNRGAPLAAATDDAGPCTADANGDGKLSVLDFIAYYNLFAAGDSHADLNGDGALNLLDMIAFQIAFTEGCQTGFQWTELAPSPDTRLVHVSSSEGDDADDGATPDTPVRTLQRAAELVRDGHPDWLLLKRGDTWTDQDFGRWQKSGRSKAEPIVIGAYGNGAARPRVLSGTATRALWLDGAVGVSHVAVVGIEFFAHTYDGTDGAQAGILWLGGGGDLLVEDCLIRGYKDNIVINGFGEVATDIRLRGSVVVDAWSIVGHAQGLYAQEATGILIEGCVFDHNGWLDGVPGAEKTVFNHNIYLQTSCDDAEVRDCLVMNASSHGLQMRCSGVIEDNLFMRNPIAILVGNLGEGPPCTATIDGNAVLFANDTAPDKPRGMGIDMHNIAGAEIVGNLLAQEDSIHEWGHALYLQASPGSPVYDLSFAGNIVHEWRGGLRFAETDIDGVTIESNVIQAVENDAPIIRHAASPLGIGIQYAANRYFSGGQPNAWYQVAQSVYDFDGWVDLVDEPDAIDLPADFLDPFRTPLTYQQSIGEQQTEQAFVKAVRAQGRLTWDERYHTRAILDYFLAGYAPAP